MYKSATHPLWQRDLADRGNGQKHLKRYCIFSQNQKRKTHTARKQRNRQVVKILSEWHQYSPNSPNSPPPPSNPDSSHMSQPLQSLELLDGLAGNMKINKCVFTQMLRVLVITRNSETTTIHYINSEYRSNAFWLITFQRPSVICIHPSLCCH